MAKKKSRRQIGEEYKLDREQRQRIQAGLIKDRYPQVRELTFQFSFRDPDHKDSSPPDKTFTLHPRDSAFFKFDCPFIECVDGGFDLSGTVKQMIEQGDLHCSGTLTCQGWQDPERVGQYHCFLKMNYNVTVSYKDNPDTLT